MEVRSVPKKRKALKGAVLFTVLSVLSVVLVLMIVTIGLAGAASKRAYAEYHDTQIAATGKSVISSVLQSFDPNGTNNNKDLGKTIYTEVGNGHTYELHLANGGNLGNGLGTVEKIEFSKAGYNSKNDFFVTGSDYMIMKVTATITMGDQTTTYTEYVSDMVNFPGKNGGNGGLLSTSGVSSTGTGMNILGPFGGGFKDYKVPSTRSTLELKNPGGYTGVQFFNDSVKINTAKIFVYEENSPAQSYSNDDINSADYQGLTVLGNIVVENNKAAFASKTNATEMSKQPYIMATGKIDFTKATAVHIGSLTDDTSNENAIYKSAAQYKEVIKKTAGNNVNVYCGSIEFATNGYNAVNINSNIYCYNDSSSVVSVIGGCDNSALTDWVKEQKDNGKYEKASAINGNIYTKGNLKLLNKKIEINGNIEVEGTLDLTALKNCTDGKYPKLASGCKIRVHQNAITPADYASNTNADYQALLSAIEFVDPATKIFPADFELDKIMGVTFDPPATTGAAQLSALENGKYNLNGSISFTSKILQNPMEMKRKYYEVDPSDSTKWYIKGSQKQSGVAPGATVITEPDQNNRTVMSITEQCVLKGEFKKSTINIKPNLTNELWITLDGVTLSGQTEIVVDDSPIDDGTGNKVKPKPVCFYIKDGTNLTIQEQSRIITKYYKDTYFSSMETNNKLKQSITIDNTGTVPSEMIPGLYVYGNRDDSVTGLENIKISNYSIVTGYIIAPRASLEVYNASEASSGISVTYNGVDYQNIAVGIIGSAIVGPVKEAQNNFTLLYVNNTANGTITPSYNMFAYSPIPGFTNY